MNQYKLRLLRTILLATILLVGSMSFCVAQKLLNAPVSITANQQSVAEVLQTISKQKHFYFSYNTDIIPGDSLVSIIARGKPLRMVLDELLAGRYMYKETGNYIILQRAVADKYSYITGNITDDETGKPVDYASVYSGSLLVSALTEDDGSFRIRLRAHSFPIRLQISKIGYADTALVIQSDLDRKIALRVRPKAVDLDEVFVYNSGADRTWLARLFVSSRLRAHSRNIGQFFVSLPYQASLTPGLGTHGRMSSQVINKLSLNVIGGYTAGVNGVELAGVFNISKRSVRVMQAAGLFNMVSGSVVGLQLAGLHNHVMDSLAGVQVTGFGNIVGGSIEGVQLAGGFNNTAGKLKGIQMSAVANLAKEHVSGVQMSGVFNRAGSALHGLQMAGVVNIAHKHVKGMQMSGLFNIGQSGVNGMQMGILNYAKNLKGVQFGVVNIADSTSGYSIGIINIVKKGKGAVSVYSNEIVPLNVAWKTGSKKIYSMLSIGMSAPQKAYTIGFGFGKDFQINRSLSLATELVSNSVYTGSWEDAIGIYRLQTLLNVRLGNRLYISAGPSVAISPDQPMESKSGFRSYPPKTFTSFDLGKSTAGWLGWQAGLSWNYGTVF